MISFNSNAQNNYPIKRTTSCSKYASSQLNIIDCNNVTYLEDTFYVSLNNNKYYFLQRLY